MNEKLSFNYLYNMSLMLWPKEIDLSEISYSDKEHKRYSVKDLYSNLEYIEETYLGTDNEVIVSNLHTAIYTILLRAAKYVTKIDISLIRNEAVRMEFERRLKSAYTSTSELNWRPKDYALVESYFAHAGQKLSRGNNNR